MKSIFISLSFLLGPFLYSIIYIFSLFLGFFLCSFVLFRFVFACTYVSCMLALLYILDTSVQSVPIICLNYSKSFGKQTNNIMNGLLHEMPNHWFMKHILFMREHDKGLCRAKKAMLTLKVLNFWKFSSYCSLKPLWSGMGEVVPARTSSTLHPPSPPTVHQLSWLALKELSPLHDTCIHTLLVYNDNTIQ